MNNKLSSIIHGALNIGLVVATVFILKIELLPLALALTLLSKWRIFNANFRVWGRNIISSSCDLIFSFSMIALLAVYIEQNIAVIILGTIYAVWVAFIKPLSSKKAIIMQAGICQFIGFSALWTLIDQGLPGVIAIILAAVLSASAVRHFLGAYDSEELQEYKSVLMVSWVVLATELAWVSWAWSISYQIPFADIFLPQIAITSSMLGYFLASIYNAASKNKASKRLALQNTLFLLGVLAIIVMFTNWSGAL